ncbi:glycerol-3-phosphate dehydrogenase [Lichenifustis flavocetrariae]|uniref:Glycerol-3-phosphate dehydrogenase n=1 Tax=Lichenifustis flavocetrariae TaxID=2949735 RepID=A0AA41Z150_9HYPH|nr:glycerol-3-phosphate dehydrogenase [Lichenifustis flavocetrariae]MCW6510903.1 glycerol-3-phosphate dehydrogenase [Lichenifustis flavocetrariae]
MTDHGIVDLAVIGGGINGAGVARDASGRGLKVLLCEKGDLAEGTSSRSGKLVHGGLRYLEYYEFRLVREALIEREVLLRSAPHIIWPMRFVLPHSPEQRPAWMVRTGLFLYDHLGGRKMLPGSRKLDLRRAPEGRAIKKEFVTAFEYSDCWVDDARLVVLNALDAKQRGAIVLTRTAATSARRGDDGLWTVTMKGADGSSRSVKARALINSAGPWVEDVIGRVAGRNSSYRVRLVKGSHIVVPKFWDGPQAYLFQNDDKRVIFVNPYEGNLCLIGTTDIPFTGRPEEATIDQSEIEYLLRVVNRYAAKPLEQKDIVSSFSGVRPLYDNNADANASAVTRDYVFEVDAPEGQPPLLSVFGGKITTFRKLAEHALDRLTKTFPTMDKAWTAEATLPGGDLPNADFAAFLAALRADYPWLSADLSEHYAHLYGTRARHLLGSATGLDALGHHHGSLLYQREVDFLRETEWALTPADILTRRTKHGLHMSADEKQDFERSMEAA